MKRKRLIVQNRDGVYHLMSRCCLGEHLLEDGEKEMFIRMMQRQAAFSGVDILAYSIMSNHFHILSRVRHEKPKTDAELLSRYRAFHEGCRISPYSITPDGLEKMLERNDEIAQHARDALLARMGDVSVFMRELKQRFTIWYNHQNGNRGTLWMERFKSLVVEPSLQAMATVAAYIDLNAVRAEQVDDPADYRFCSYAAAMGGKASAIEGYRLIYGGRSFADAIAGYRLCLFGKGAKPKGDQDKDRGVISEEKLDEVIRSGGKVEMSELLRRRVRYFSDGMAIGSRLFLKEIYEQHRDCFPESRKARFASMKGTDWGGLQVVRDLKVNLFG
ncbi:MAG: Transposase IS200 like protein [Verrucomicrobia bacterium ADurb.Bin474]|nr:MAG: Transposase IS200 like protein [Verrucomicrobia bacterium ADurb.Bin474]